MGLTRRKYVVDVGKSDRKHKNQIFHRQLISGANCDEG